MNSQYNVESAARTLEQLAAERSREKLAGTQLANQGEGDLSSIAEVVEVGTGAAVTKRLARKDGNPAEEGEELVWHVQGVLASIGLIPSLGPNIRSKEKAKYIRQGVKICGLNTPTFNKAVRVTTDILALFSRSVNSIQPPTFMENSDSELGTTIDTSNRFFSSRVDDRGGSAVPLDKDIDPSGRLAKMAGPNYYHGEENVVYYYERVVSKMTGKKSIKAVSPVMFKVGDLVKVQLTYMLVKVKDSQWKMVATLRCITLLETKFAQECIRSGLDLGTTCVHHGGGRSLKRRAGANLDDSETEDTEDAMNKVRRMNIDNEPDIRQFQ